MIDTRKLTVRVTSFKPFAKNTLVGFARVHIDEIRLTIDDVAVHRKNTAACAQLSARPWLKDGAVVLDERGRIQYSPILAFDTREVADAFSRSVIKALLEIEPAPLDNGGTAA
jgi:hypothetical protein